jgi:hypothetical protein
VAPLKDSVVHKCKVVSKVGQGEGSRNLLYSVDDRIEYPGPASLTPFIHT